jgi:hypothetical protein
VNVLASLLYRLGSARLPPAFRTSPGLAGHEEAGPTLTRAQFYRAIATASVSNWNVVLDHPPPLSFQISINSVEADWDDESGKVEVRVEIHLSASGGPLMAVTQLRYWVAILAQI